MDLYFRLWIPGKTASACTSAEQMVSLARLTCEMYLVLAAGEGNPRQRYERLLCLHRAGGQELLSGGLHEVHAWLPLPSPKNSTAHSQP